MVPLRRGVEASMPERAWSMISLWQANKKDLETITFLRYDRCGSPYDGLPHCVFENREEFPLPQFGCWMWAGWSVRT